jgi:dTDP-4-dehydrorhamnose reductase
MTAATPNILLLGRTGQVGYELERTLAPLGRVTALSRAQADLSQPESLRAVVRTILNDRRPAVIVNAAAHTAVDKAEQEEDLALRINGAAPGVLAEEAQRLGALLVHYSTDYVFDGAKAGPYVETDACAPVGAYGRTKLAGERAIASAGAAHLIFRTSWVYGARGGNFYRTMRRLFAERDELRVVSDQVGAPTWSRAIAEATVAVLAQLLAPRAVISLRDIQTLREASGIYHLTAAGETSWHGFASAILALQPPPDKAPPRLTPIPTSEYPTPARRPLNSRMDSAKLRATFGVALPDWHDALALVAQAG